MHQHSLLGLQRLKYVFSDFTVSYVHCEALGALRRSFGLLSADHVIEIFKLTSRGHLLLTVCLLSFNLFLIN